MTYCESVVNGVSSPTSKPLTDHIGGFNIHVTVYMDMVHRLDHNGGYEVVRFWVCGEKIKVPIHRLQAVAKYGFDEVVDKHVHHRNHVSFDNRMENLEVLDGDEHRSHHSSEGVDTIWRDYDFITELLNSDYSMEYLMEYFDCSRVELEHYDTYQSYDEVEKVVESMVEECECPWREVDVLIHFYFGRGMRQQEIADHLGCSNEPISRHMRENGMKARRSTLNMDTPWRDEDTLRTEYKTKGRSMQSIADGWDCSRATVSLWLDKHNIEKRPSPQELAKSS